MLRINSYSFWLVLTLLPFLNQCTNAVIGTNEHSPNIIILLADDLGYGDLSCYGGQANTPNLDKLAKSGIRFTDFYAAASNCSPSRAGLLTGRSPSEIGVYSYIPPNHQMHLRSEEITFAEIAKTQGYRTGHFGKWHLSSLENQQLNQPKPSDQGFEYSLGTSNNSQPTHLNPRNFVRNGIPAGIIEGYSCDIVASEAQNWLDTIQSEKNPFLLYLAFHEPHKIVASPPELTAKYSNLPQKDAEYLANVENMDEAIGKIVNYLEIHKLRENTIILFASDNGSYRNGSNAPLLGGKSFVYEGGIRVPGIISWPKKIQAKQEIDEAVGLIDIMPTICEIIGTSHPNKEQLDGVSLYSLLQGEDLERKKPLTWFFYRTSPEMAMRIDDHVVLAKDSDTSRYSHQFDQKAMKSIAEITFESFELYDLRKDKEQTNSIGIENAEHGLTYQKLINEKLYDIQRQSYYWDRLPTGFKIEKLKSEWRQLRPKGFSN